MTFKEALIDRPPGADNSSSVDCGPIIQGAIGNFGQSERQQGELIRFPLRRAADVSALNAGVLDQDGP